jgi:hypothetical protein
MYTNVYYFSVEESITTDVSPNCHHPRPLIVVSADNVPAPEYNDENMIYI